MELGYMMRVDDFRFEVNEFEMRRFNEDYRGLYIEVDCFLFGRLLLVGGFFIRMDRLFDNSLRVDGGLNF